jgi:hypothetical protein
LKPILLPTFPPTIPSPSEFRHQASPAGEAFLSLSFGHSPYAMHGLAFWDCRPSVALPAVIFPGHSPFLAPLLFAVTAEEESPCALAARRASALAAPPSRSCLPRKILDPPNNASTDFTVQPGKRPLGLASRLHAPQLTRKKRRQTRSETHDRGNQKPADDRLSKRHGSRSLAGRHRQRIPTGWD